MSASSDEPAATDDFPTSGRLLGLDYGTRRIGVAVSNFDQTIASPVLNYTRQGTEPDDRALRKLVEEYEVRGVVVGLPVHLNGDEGIKAREAREYGRHVARAVGLPVRYWDERFTSARAEELLIAADVSRAKRKQRLDKLAAAFLLQAYLDAPDRTRPPDRYHDRPLP